MKREVPLELRWTVEARDQLAAIAEHISIASPVYADQVVARVQARFDQVRTYPESGRVVPEFARRQIRELIEPPYRLVYRVGTGYLEVIVSTPRAPAVSRGAGPIGLYSHRLTNVEAVGRSAERSLRSLFM